MKFLLFIGVFIVSFFVLGVYGAFIANRQQLETNRKYGRVFLTTTGIIAFLFTFLVVG